jgi:hypothetical protein
MYPSQFAVFEKYLLKECGCNGAANSPCMGTCTAQDCASTMMSQVSQACQACLTNEASKGLGSTCTITAAESDCNSDASCKAFSKCGLCCATQGGPC